MNWYIINVYSGHENRVADTIREHIEKKGFTEIIKEVLVPSEEVIEISKGEKKKINKEYFPGYILIKMNLTNEAWHFIRGIPRVSSFLGSGGKPVPIRKEEVEKILQRIEEGGKNVKKKIVFSVGEQVRICDGPFNSFNGLVEEVDHEKSRVKVSVMIFGRSTPVDLDFVQVEKI